MASYHCQVKTISRGAGRSATAAAAYRAGERIACEREGRTHDYTRKQGIEASFIHAPTGAPDWVQDRATLWNKAEEAEVRSNARVAREWELALPHELSAAQRQQLASDYARALVDRYGAAVDVSIHAPHRQGDQRNHHAHIMVTTRVVGPDGFGGKTRVLDDRKTGPKEIEATREMWADMQNERLHQADLAERVDHRSLEAQRAEAQARGDEALAAKLDRPAEKHMGPDVSAMERRAQRRAAREGRDYQPVTERGREVADVREYRSLFESVKELRSVYNQARQDGQGRFKALRSGLRAITKKETTMSRDHLQRLREDMRGKDKVPDPNRKADKYDLELNYKADAKDHHALSSFENRHETEQRQDRLQREQKEREANDRQAEARDALKKMRESRDKPRDRNNDRERDR